MQTNEFWYENCLYCGHRIKVDYGPCPHCGGIRDREPPPKPELNLSHIKPISLSEYVEGKKRTRYILTKSCDTFHYVMFRIKDTETGEVKQMALDIVNIHTASGTSLLEPGGVSRLENIVRSHIMRLCYSLSVPPTHQEQISLIYG